MSASEEKVDSGEAIAAPKVKLLPIVQIGRSQIMDKDISILLKYGRLEKEEFVRKPEGEETPNPRLYEMVVFKDYFIVGLQLSCDALLGDVLDRYKIEPHDLTPNDIACISQFVWACRSQGIEPNIDTFARIFELHRQPKKANFLDSQETFETQYGSCSFTPRKKGVSLVDSIINLALKWKKGGQ